MNATMEERSVGGRGTGLRRALATTSTVFLGMVLGAGTAEAQQVGEVQEVCASCHLEVEPDRGRTTSHPDSITCLSCHHVGFTNDPAKAREARLDACSTCHADVSLSHPGIEEGAPECTACHSLHDDPPLSESPLPAERCESCHEQPHVLHRGVADEEAPACTSCHASHDGHVPSGEDPAVLRQCVSCHEGAHPSHPVTDRAPSCTTCHELSAASSALTVTDLSSACVECHSDVAPAHPDVEGDAPVCTDCHSFSDDPPLPEARPLLAQRCASCHEDAMEAYASGGHAGGLDAEAANTDLPDCVTCHATHDERAVGRGSVRLLATIQCVDCHSDAELTKEYGLLPSVGESYMDDFHGTTLEFQATHSGAEDQPEVLTCSDCHGSHAVVASDEARIADVCLRCHERGDVNLAGAWLGHAPASPRNNAGIWLVRLAYFFLIPFILVGLTLHIVLHLRDQQRKGAAILRTDGIRRLKARLTGEKLPRQQTVQRFTLGERLEHVASMATFTLLVMTGVPQLDPEFRLARWIIELFGGVETTRVVHRTAGFVFVALLLLHVGRAIARAIRERRLPVMVPSRDDFDSTLATVKHFIRGTPRPKVGKFDFMQKFEYWGLLLGGMVISLTGLVLVYPELVSRLLPGEIVAASRVIHGLEATLAVLTVVLWHSYGVIFRPEIFPLDTTIFSGKMSVERLKEEHALEYERLFGNGTRPEVADGDDEPPAKRPRRLPEEVTVPG
ncbi:MAG: cytochrome c3 family protein [Gemmatimonadota bacterium]|jgi:cytochrome b subunit of formate dehydrogenase